MMHKSALALAVLGLVCLTVGAPARYVRAADMPAPAASAAAIVVHTKDFAYKPVALTIPVGTAVTFVNDDDTAHTITAVDQAGGKPIFDSGNMDKGAKWTHTFKTAGTFKYVCAYHPFMKATIVVEPAPSAT
jgi:plastocyanin